MKIGSESADERRQYLRRVADDVVKTARQRKADKDRELNGIYAVNLEDYVLAQVNMEVYLEHITRAEAKEVKFWALREVLAIWARDMDLGMELEIDAAVRS